MKEEVYNSLSISEKETYLKTVSKQYPKFKFSHFEEFNKNGINLYTAIYTYKNAEFVFIPSDVATLGWNGFTQNLSEKMQNEIKENWDKWNTQKFEVHLKENTSPIRTVEIPAMLVERKLNNIGYKLVPITDEQLTSYQKEIERFKKSDYNQFTLNDEFRIIREGNEFKTFLIEQTSYKTFLKSVASEGFSLPTENEWEYLCSGGNRTFFPWGDNFDFNLNLKYFSKENDLETPNHFGIYIAYNPYKYEVLDDENFLKGGDGGCAICGGSGVLLSYLSTAPYFREYDFESDILDYKEDIGGDYTCYRRVFRLY